MKIVSFCLLLLFSAQAFSQTQQFKAGDKIAFTGNSITHGGHFHSYIWLYYMTHFPERRITIINTGIGANSSGQIYDRLDGDVLSKRPNIIYLTYGMNDAGYFEYLGPTADSFGRAKISQANANLLKIEKKLQQHADIKKVFFSSPSYDETVRPKKNYFPGKTKAMLAMADSQQAVANHNGWDFIDLERGMINITKTEQAKDSTFTLDNDDHIHPSNEGHMVIAYLMLKAQGLAGTPVADVSIDAASDKINKSSNCTISNVKNNAGTLSFNYLAKSLPYPIDTVARSGGSQTQADALKVVPFMKDFNQEMLTITGLKGGTQYRLVIDSTIIGTWPSEAFASGINLASYPNTPQYQQATALMYLNEDRWEIEKKTRDLAYVEYSVLQPKGLLHQYNLATMDTLRLMSDKNEFFMRGSNFDAYARGRYKSMRDAWQKQMDVLTDEIYATNKPVVHKISIEAVSN